MANNRYGDYGEGWRSDRDRYGERDRERRYGGGRENSSWGERRSFSESDYGQGDARYGSERYGGRDDNLGGYDERRYVRGDDYGGMGGGMSGGYGREGAGRYYGRGQSYGGQSYGSQSQSYGGQSGGQSYGGRDRNWMERTGDRMASWFNDDDDRERTTGQFRGRGPKGYRRSDERIREDVCDRLSDDPMLDASEIEVRVQNGEVTLEGSVSDRQDKRRAETLVESCSGVDHVQNNIRVQQQSYGQSRSSTSTGAGQTATGQNEALSRVTEGKTS